MTIHVVQANPALDRVEVVDRLELGSVNRASSVLAVAGGKGLNVARALRRSGQSVAAYGPLGGLIGEYLRRSCVDLGISDRHIATPGETRVCVIVVDQDREQSTVINEPGPVLTAEDERELIASVVSHRERDEFVVMCGSLPPGVSPQLYAHLVAAVQARGARAVVDTSGDALAYALDSRPWMIKANAQELAAAGVSTSSISKQVRSGTEWVIATRGAEGATASSATASWNVSVPAVEVVNATGAGDIFLAALLDSLSSNHSMRIALRRAAAWAAASVRTVAPEMPSDAHVADVLAKTRVTQG